MLLCSVGYTNIFYVFLRGGLFLPLLDQTGQEIEGKTCMPKRCYRVQEGIDALIVDDIIWTPYAVHRGYREFDDTSLFSGYLRREKLVARHVPERCIPQPVPTTPFEGIDRWFVGHVSGSIRSHRDCAVDV